LPDYAWILNYFVLDESFTFANGQITENGRLRRDAIELRYKKEINALYESSKDLSVL